MLPSFASEQVVLVRPQIINERGTEVLDYENAERITVNDCLVQPISAATSWNDERQPQTVRAVLYLPPNTDVYASDCVEHRGSRYAIDGVPMDVRSPSGRLNHILCNLIDWRG